MSPASVRVGVITQIFSWITDVIGAKFRLKAMLNYLAMAKNIIKNNVIQWIYIKVLVMKLSTK